MSLKNESKVAKISTIIAKIYLKNINYCFRKLLVKKNINSLFQIWIVGQVSRTSEVVGDEVVTVGDAGVELVAVFRVGHQQPML
jgi:hypothetical protein